MQLKEQQRNYYKTLQDYAALLETTLKEQAPSFSGSLRDSITGEIEFDAAGTANIGIYMTKHGTYINEGVNGAKSSFIENKNSRFRYKDKMPPISALQAWANAKGINPWALRYSIYTKGIKRNPFIERSFSDGTLDKMANDIAESIWTDFYVSLEDKKINK